MTAVIRIGRGRWGRGVLARREIQPGEELCRNAVLLVPHDEVGPFLGRYTFSFSSRSSGLIMGAISFCNHSTSPNAEVHECADRRTLRLVACAPIAPGEEVFIDYGYEPDE